MTERRLPLAVRAIVRAIAPRRWRESLAGDLTEERHRRVTSGRRSGVVWLAGAAAASAVRLRLEQYREVPMTLTPGKALSALVTGLRQAIRGLVARPAFTVISVATLTLGIGATTAVFSVANWLIFRPVPGVSDPDGLVSVEIKFNRGGFYFISARELSEVGRAPGLTAVAAAADASFNLVLGDSAPARVTGGVVTSNYFDVLGTHIARGRGFSPAEDDPGLAMVAIVSDRFWRGTLGGDPAVLNRSLTLNGATFAIVGVAEAEFRGPDRLGHADIWVPLASHRASLPSYPATLLTGNTQLFGAILARRAPGSTIAQINDQLAAVQQTLAQAFPKDSKYGGATFAAEAGPNVPQWQREGLRQMFALLLTVVGLLLLLSCANAANLLFARAHERAAELATRQALGASRGAVVRMLLFEGLALAAISSALALVIAWGLGTSINGLVIARNLPALSEIGIDWRVLTFSIALSTVVCIAASLLPAIVGSRVDLVSALKAGGRGQTPPGRRLRQALTAVQVGVAVTLLGVGGLLVRSMLARYSVPLGYDTKNVLAFSVETSVQGYSDERTRQYLRDSLVALRRLPEVSRAGFGWIEPFRMVGGGIGLMPADQPDAEAVSGDMNAISDGYLPALGVRFLAGRDFAPDEVLRPASATTGAMIVNETMARKLFGATDVAGRDVAVQHEPGRRFTIVGVVADIRTRDVSYAPVKATAFRPIGQGFLSGWGTMHVRLNGTAAGLIPQVRRAMRDVDPQVPIYDVKLLSDAVNRHLAEQRLLSKTIASFAGLAAVVAALGLYGVLARGVAERRREFSIRTALGAGPWLVARLVTREALVLTVIGGMIGLTSAALLGRAIEARLFGVQPFDPVSLAAALSVVFATALAASLGPARTAARVDVVNELR